MAEQYIAITIGPIVDTLSLAESPGALWCASSLFSDLSLRLCKQLFNTWHSAKFLCPAFDPSADYHDGIGRYPDRIFLKLPADACPTPAETLPHIISTVKEDIAVSLCDTVPPLKQRKKMVASFLQKYLQVNYVVAPEAVAQKDNRNCILNLSPILNSLELSVASPADCTFHPLLTLFNSRTEQLDSQNAYLRDCYLAKNATDNFQLRSEDGKTIRDIGQIAHAASVPSDKKITNYFAVLQADGDHMGALLEKCTSEDLIVSFSRACMEYNSCAAALVGLYGGMTIYAGGDDLLCLLPLTGKNGDNLLTLCKKLTEKFDECFQKIFEQSTSQNEQHCIASDKEECPSLSIGISVNYEHFPLYEAFEQARSLLFCTAKSRRQTIAVSVRKASGQSFGLILPNCPDSPTESLRLLIGQEWTELVRLLTPRELDKDMPKTLSEIDRSIHSVLYAFHTFQFGFKLCEKKGISTENLFQHFFDNAAQECNRGYLTLVQLLCEQLRADKRCAAILLGCDSTLSDGTEATSVRFGAIAEAMLRFAKLYTEKGGKR